MNESLDGENEKRKIYRVIKGKNIFKNKILRNSVIFASVTKV